MSSNGYATTMKPEPPWDGAEVEFSPRMALDQLCKEWQVRANDLCAEASHAEERARKARAVAQEAVTIWNSLSDASERLAADEQVARTDAPEDWQRRKHLAEREAELARKLADMNQKANPFPTGGIS